MDNLVVIATHKGNFLVENLLSSMEDHLTAEDYRVLLVETSDDTASFKGLLGIAKKYPGESITVVRAAQGEYCTGAFLWAYKNYMEADNYVFLHDSVQVKRHGWLEKFTESLSPVNATGWLSFGMWFDNEEQRKFITDIYGEDMPAQGMFGPIFSATRESLERLDSLGLLPIPASTKILEQGWERGWAIAFHQAGVTVNYLNDGVTGERLDMDEYSILRKYRPNRQ